MNKQKVYLPSGSHRMVPFVFMYTFWLAGNCECMMHFQSLHSDFSHFQIFNEFSVHFQTNQFNI